MYALQKAIDEKEHTSSSSSVGRSRDQDEDSMNRGTPAGDIASLSEVN